MTNSSELYSPGHARHILSNFVDLAERNPEVEDYQDLKNRVGSEIGRSLASLITQTGKTTKKNTTGIPSVLKNRNKLSVATGSLILRDNKEERPSTILLDKYALGPISIFRKKQWLHMTANGVEDGSAASDGSSLYIPYSVSDKYIRFFRDEVGTTIVYGSSVTQTGLELAGEASRNSGEVLANYLKLAAEIIKTLVTTD